MDTKTDYISGVAYWAAALFAGIWILFLPNHAIEGLSLLIIPSALGGIACLLLSQPRDMVLTNDQGAESFVRVLAPNHQKEVAALFLAVIRGGVTASVTAVGILCVRGQVGLSYESLFLF